LKRLLFTDLDDTLFQSHRKQTPDPQFKPMAYLENGEVISYASPTQQTVLSILEVDFTIIPVTARSKGGFDRVAYRFPAEAVLNYGGVILDAKGVPDAEWLDKMAHQAAQTKPALMALQEALNAYDKKQGLGLRLHCVADFGLDFYSVAKSSSDVLTGLDQLRAFFETQLPDISPLFHIHQNANNLAFMPLWLDKKQAVAHLLDRYRAQGEALLTWGMGDSLVDLGFMQLCDYQIVPPRTQIAHYLERAHR
jgi:hydroxymethylpyrimidine pyrophosphatase-like HAD family hydrolase